jgi:pyruvate/2-oxoglutarate dehydrogenase complex dihydrolipoamide acyltransferase (E2) component
MTDPTYALIIAFVLVALVTAVVIPAPAHAPDNEESIQLSLQGAACALIILMGALALSGHHAESTISGAVAWLLVMPCIWLSRAPGSIWSAEEEDDDDGGGSPTPRRPSAPPAPDDRLPGLRPPAVPGGHSVWAANAAQPAPLVATAARVRLLLAAQEAERLQATGEVQRLLAAAAALPQPQPQPQPEPAAAIVPEPAPAAPMPLHWPDPHDLQPAPRERADHRTIVHLIAAVAHAQGRRRRAAAKAEREQAARRATSARY